MRKTYKSLITSLLPNQIFVFGSNTQGRHGAGAAAYALKYFGAIYGQATGLQGQSYGLITVDLRLKQMSKSPITRTSNQIMHEIIILYKFARKNRDKEFLIAYSDTPLLCGYTARAMALMFRDSGRIPYNIVFEEGFNKLVYNGQRST